MPTFRNDVKLGTKVPLIKTDDLDDRCVTEEKLDGNIMSYMKEDVAESTYEKMKDKFLPLTGGTIEGKEETTGKTIVTLGSQPQTILKGGNIVVKKAYLRKPLLGTTYPPGTSMLNIEDTVSISEKSIIGLQSETATSGWDKSNLKFQIDKDGVQANGFKTISQNIQGLLANDGSIATAISEGDIDKMFNR